MYGGLGVTGLGLFPNFTNFLLVALHKTTFVVLTDRTDVNAILCYQGNPTSKIPNHLKMLFIYCFDLLKDLVEGGLWRRR